MRIRVSDRSLAIAVATGAVVVALAAACDSGGTDHAEPAAEPGRAKIVAALHDLISVDRLPGAQVVRTEHGKAWTATAGVGDLERGTPFQDNARVRIASNTKTFVATVMLQLAAEGKVELDAPVERYLPGVVHGPGIDGNRITIRNLLQHTSGIPEYAAEFGTTPKPGQIDTHDERIRWGRTDIAEVVRNALTAPADFEPGARWTYSNTNYALAGMVLEKITGFSIGAEITHRIIDRLGLPDTYYPDADEVDIRGPHPRGYARIDGKLVDYTEQNVTSAGAAGAMVSSGADLNRFLNALLGGELLPPAQLEEMKRTVPLGIEGQSASYGLGLLANPLSCGTVGWGHGGDIDGFETRGGATDDGRAVTVSVNQVPESGETTGHLNAIVDLALCAGS